MADHILFVLTESVKEKERSPSGQGETNNQDERMTEMTRRKKDALITFN